MFTQLPAELILLVLYNLDLRSIRTLTLVSKYWKHFIDENESSVYHALAVQHGYIPSRSLDFSLLSSLYSSKSLQGVTDWKSFCQRRVHINRSWAGKTASRYAAYSSTGDAVHRIKVDENAGLIITSFRNGGLRVCDIKENEILWSLPESYVKQYAHLEYGQGYLIFDCLGGSKEVWRLASDIPAGSTSSSKSKITPEQCNASEGASNRHSATYPKGHFKPWAMLKMPRPTRAFRFVYPTLLVGAWDHAFLWDIPSIELIQTIASVQQPEDPVAQFAVVLASAPIYGVSPPRLGALENLNYVEVDSTHVFVCGINALRVFSRATGRCILDVPSARREWGHRKFTLLYESDRYQESVLVNQHTSMEEFSSTSPLPERSVDEFVAVHVSSCGRHLVAMLASSRVVIIKDFEKSPASLFDRMIQIQLGFIFSHSKYLAIHQDHLAVATNNGLFIFSLSDTLNANAEKPLVISRVPYFGYNVYMSNVTCLQLSDAGLYLNWDPAYLAYSEASSEEQDRLESVFRTNVNNRTTRYARMPTGDLIVLLDDEEFLTEIASVCGIDFVPAIE
ncbi:hypothetical protein D9757_004139 [Collybiopsis confluens]|uniref:F-box domain-containing protein n=1 Tax=Collybiopsis confluens TaxID=2823264 RepID=A0A8H5MD94_9AGAR|nr:hypothetical protein D9757_004139 [Collybiopsis confluens]